MFYYTHRHTDTCTHMLIPPPTHTQATVLTSLSLPLEYEITYFVDRKVQFVFQRKSQWYKHDITYIMQEFVPDCRTLMCKRYDLHVTNQLSGV